jgi:hypothetical protein
MFCSNETDLRLRVTMLFVVLVIATFTTARAQDSEDDSADSVYIEINIDSLRAVPPNSIRVGIGGSAYWTGESDFQIPPFYAGMSRRNWMLTGSMEGFFGHVEGAVANLYGIEPLAVMGRLRIGYLDGEASRTGSNPNAVAPYNQPVHRRAYFTVASAHLEFLLEYSPLSILTLRVGHSIGYRHSVSGEIWQTVGAGGSINDDTLSSTPPPSMMALERIFSGEWDKEFVDAFSFGPIAQIASPWPITNRITLTPEFGIRWELNRLPVDSEIWPAIEMHGGMTLTYALDTMWGEEPGE